MKDNNSKAPKIVMIGGGTGNFTLLSELKNYVQDITALVNMVDNGGSTGVLRDELGALPPGDVRQNLVALSRSTDTMRELFNYRFPEGTFGGHSFGNLFITALEKITDNFAEAVELAGDVLHIQGRVLPMTLNDVSLVYEAPDGNKVVGEAELGEVHFNEGTRPNLYLEPAAHVNPDARQAILDADMVVIAPGNLYRSLIPSLLVGGVSEALMDTKAKVVYVCNLVNDSKQTSGFSVHGFVSELERFIGPEGIDYVLYNTMEPTDEQKHMYAEKNIFPVEFKEEEYQDVGYYAVGKELLSRRMVEQKDNDMMQRNLIRHDGEVVARELMRIFFS